METKEWRTVDREAAGWISGEWDSEPDKVQWPDEKTGLPCLAVRNRRSGNWCGYVGVAAGHPAFEKHYDAVYDMSGIDVHGGLTFSDSCRPGDTEATGICHVPGDGEPDHVWWLGFDCAHSGDHGPDDATRSRTKGGIWALGPMSTYKTLQYVKAECCRLAWQLADLASNPENA